jgi:DNA-binding transcriptional LysR family regulator
LLPRALRHFQETNPGIRIQLHDLSTQEMLRGLRDGKLHAALIVQLSVIPAAGLVFDEIQRHAVAVAMHPAHPLARKRGVSLKTLVHARLIAFTLADYPEYHAWIAELFAPLKRTPQIVEEHDSATSLIAAVESGRGIALVSQRLECLAGPRLKIVPVKPAPPPLIIGVARPAGRASPAVESFIRATKEKS